VTEAPAAQVAQIVDDDEVMLDAAASRAPHPVEHFDDGADRHFESRLLEHFPGDGVVEGFTELHASTREAPLAFERLAAALDQEDAFAVEDDGANADDRPGGLAG
jgi:hypothetical protein